MESEEDSKVKAKTVAASEVCASIFDGTHDSPKRMESGFKLITSRHIKDGEVVLDDAHFITEGDYQKIQIRSGLEAGDVLFTMIGTVGDVCRVKSKPDFAIKNIGVFRPKEKSDSLWLYYYLISPQGKRCIEVSKQGTTQQFMGLKELRNLPINFPGNTRYRSSQIGILNLIDTKIAINNKIARTLEGIAQAIFKSWFIDFDPVKAKMAGEKPVGMDEAMAALFPDSMEDSELGPIPKGWGHLSASEIFEVGIGRTPPRIESKWFCDGGNGVDWVSIRDMGTYGVFADGTNEGLTEEAVQKFRVPIVPKGTVLMSFKLTVGKLCITDRELVTNEAIAHFKETSKSSIGSIFAYLWLANQNMANLDSTSSIGTATNSSIVKAMKFLVPSEKVHSAFVNVVGEMFAEIENLTEQTNQLIEIRDAMLPRLISGELQVPEEMLVW